MSAHPFENLRGDFRSTCALCLQTVEVINVARVCQRCTEACVAGWARRGKIAMSGSPDPDGGGPPHAAGAEPAVLAA